MQIPQRSQTFKQRLTHGRRSTEDSKVPIYCRHKSFGKLLQRASGVFALISLPCLLRNSCGNSTLDSSSMTLFKLRVELMLWRQPASEISILRAEFRRRISGSGFYVSSAVLRTFREFSRFFLIPKSPIQSKLPNRIIKFDEKLTEPSLALINFPRRELKLCFSFIEGAEL